MDQTEKTLHDYLAVLVRRRDTVLWLFVLLTGCILLASTFLPQNYRSTANLLMQMPLPADTVQTMEPDYAGKRVQALIEKTLIRSALLDVIQTLNLYPEQAPRMTPQEQEEQFRKKLEIRPVKANVLPDDSDDSQKSTEIVFSLSYAHEQPEKAQEATRKLVDLLIAKNDAERTEKADRKAAFLNAETDKLRTAIADIENRISQFKQNHDGSLPEQLETNWNTILRKQDALRDVEKSLEAARERMDVIAADMSLSSSPIQTTTPTRPNDSEPEPELPLDPVERLKQLEQHYIALTGRYLAQHPDVRRVKHQIQTLDPRWTEPSALPSQKPVNPATEVLKIRYQAGQVLVRESLDERNTLQKEINSLQQKIALVPAVEKDYVALLRERDNAVVKYKQLKDKLTDAELTKTLESAQQGQTLTLIEAPDLPLRPDDNLKYRIILASVFLGLIISLGTAFVLESLHPKIYGKRDLTALTGLVPLTIIPYLETPHEVNRRLAKARRNRVTWMTFMAGIVVLIVLMAGWLRNSDTGWVRESEWTHHAGFNSSGSWEHGERETSLP